MITVYLICFLSVGASANQLPLPASFVSARSAYVEKGINTEKFEADTKDIVASQNDPVEKGRILFLFVQTVCNRHPDLCDLTVSYVNQALQYPLSVNDSIQLIVYRADAFEIRSLNEASETKRKDQLLALQSNLKAFDLVFSNLKQDHYLPPPSVSEYDIGPSNNPALLAAQAQHDTEMRHRTYVKEQDFLVIMRPHTEKQIRYFIETLNLPKSDIDRIVKENVASPSAVDYVLKNLISIPK